MPARVRIASGEGEQRIARIRGRFASLQPVMEGPLRELFRQFAIQQWKTRGSYGGSPWAPLKASTIAKKKKEGTYRWGTLKSSKRLYESLAHRDHEDFYMRATNRGVTFGTRVPYAFRHQEGTPHMVAREIIPEEMPEDFMRKLRNIVTGYIVDAELGGAA
jgi:hypothetical protein